jgi:hypothetical protein
MNIPPNPGIVTVGPSYDDVLAICEELNKNWTSDGFKTVPVLKNDEYDTRCLIALLSVDSTRPIEEEFIVINDWIHPQLVKGNNGMIVRIMCSIARDQFNAGVATGKEHAKRAIVNLVNGAIGF